MNHADGGEGAGSVYYGQSKSRGQSSGGQGALGKIQ